MPAPAVKHVQHCSPVPHLYMRKMQADQTIEVAPLRARKAYRWGKVESGKACDGNPETVSRLGYREEMISD